MIKTIPISRAKTLITIANASSYDASMSGDGSTVVFPGPRNKQGLYRLKIDKPAVEQIGTGICCWSDVSDDGDTVVFSQYGEKDDSIHRWTPEGTELVDKGPGISHPLDVSDDGKTVVWEDFKTGAEYENAYWSDTYLQKTGEAPVKLPGKAKSAQAKISGDGQRVFWLDIPGGGKEPEVWLDGSSAPPKPLDFSAYSVSQFEVDDSGKTIAFAGKDADSSTFKNDLYLHSLSDGKTTEVSADPHIDEGDPFISGDGSTLAYTATYGAGDVRVRVFRDGQNYEIDAPARGYHKRPRLSDDGNTMIWTHKAWGSDEGTIYKLDLTNLGENSSKNPALS